MDFLNILHEVETQCLALQSIYLVSPSVVLSIETHADADNYQTGGPCGPLNFIQLELAC